MNFVQPRTATKYRRTHTRYSPGYRHTCQSRTTVKRRIAYTRYTVRYRHACQSRTTTECIRTYARYAVGYHHACQPRAATEYRIVYARYAVRYRHARHSRATTECIRTYARYTVGYHHACQSRATTECIRTYARYTVGYHHACQSRATTECRVAYTCYTFIEIYLLKIRTALESISANIFVDSNRFTSGKSIFSYTFDAATKINSFNSRAIFKRILSDTCDTVPDNYILQRRTALKGIISDTDIFATVFLRIKIYTCHVRAITKSSFSDIYFTNIKNSA